MSSATVKRVAGVGAVLAAAFISGFATETTSLYNEFWPGVLLLGALVLLLTVALAAGGGKKVRFLTAAVSGVLVGFLAGIMLVLGALSPFALELGERDLGDAGGDLAWDTALTFALIYVGAVVAVVGAVCGTAAWALRFALGQMRSADDRAKREAAGER